MLDFWESWKSHDGQGQGATHRRGRGLGDVKAQRAFRRQKLKIWNGLGNSKMCKLPTGAGTGLQRNGQNQSPRLVWKLASWQSPFLFYSFHVNCVCLQWTHLHHKYHGGRWLPVWWQTLAYFIFTIIPLSPMKEQCKRLSVPLNPHLPHPGNIKCLPYQGIAGCICTSLPSCCLLRDPRVASTLPASLWNERHNWLGQLLLSRFHTSIAFTDSDFIWSTILRACYFLTQTFSSGRKGITRQIIS